MTRSVLSRMITYASGVSLVLATVAVGAAPAHAQSGSGDRITGVELADVDVDRVAVTWDAPSSVTDSTFYRVELRSGSDRRFQFATGPEVTFTGLAPGHAYQTRVEVAFMPQTWSEQLQFTTADVSKPATPVNVAASTEPGSVTVTWDPVDSAEVDTYLVRWSSGRTDRVSSGTSLTREVASGADNLDVTVTARDQFWQESEPSEPVEVTVPPAAEWTALAAPGSLRLVADGSGVVERVEWDAATGGADQVNYTLHYHFGDMDPSTARPIVQAGTATSIDLAASVPTPLRVCPPDPRPANTWVVWVVASSGGATSPPSEQQVVCF